MNPYQVTKRAADTLNLIMERRLEFRLAGDGTAPPFQRCWRTVGGGVGWHKTLLRYANGFLDAGLIDYERPHGCDVDQLDQRGELRSWTPVFATRAGLFLFDTWRRHPFTVIDESPSALTRADRALSAAYVIGAGLLEDRPHRYADAVRPHVEAVVDALRVER